MTGFGAYPGRMMVTEPNIPEILDYTNYLAHWSGKITTINSITNRVPGSSVPSLLLSDASGEDTFPSIITLPNGIKAIRFDGNRDACMTPNVLALRYASPAYWAFHLRGHRIAPLTFTELILLHLTESARIGIDRNDDGLFIQINAGDWWSPYAHYVIPEATILAGMFLEIIFDGSQPAVTLTSSEQPTSQTLLRLKVYVNSIEIPCHDGGGFPGTGIIPATLLTGDNAQSKLMIAGASQNQGQFDFAHIYLGQVIPSLIERATLKNFELPQWS